MAGVFAILWILLVSVESIEVSSSGLFFKNGVRPQRLVDNTKITVLTPRGGQQGEQKGVPALQTTREFAVNAGILLAFSNGYMNGCCLSGTVAADRTKQPVVAVTGTYTLSALGLAGGDMKQFQTQVSVLFSYITGSTIAGLLNPSPALFQIPSSVGYAFLVASCLLFLSCFLSHYESPTKTLFYLAAMASGIHNSITSVHTANLVRSTHYSGISSDIGSFLGQVLRGNHENLGKLIVFVKLAASFWIGGFVAFFATKEYAGLSLLFSAILNLIIGMAVIFRSVPNTSSVDLA
jgi:uncharacterized membrane protein YoaK (UPF0700 family)